MNTQTTQPPADGGGSVAPPVTNNINNNNNNNNASNNNKNNNQNVGNTQTGNTIQKPSLVNNTLSSLPLQMIIYFHSHYAPLFFFLNICLFTYKAIKFYYPGRFLGWELTTIFLYILIDKTRLLMASKGNKTGTISPFGYSLVLSAPIIILHAYYITLQTYVLKVDVVINAIALIFLGVELLMSGMSMLNLYLISRKI